MHPGQSLHVSADADVTGTSVAFKVAQLLLSQASLPGFVWLFAVLAAVLAKASAPASPDVILARSIDNRAGGTYQSTRQRQPVFS